ncbi:MAG: sensor histidine kinase [Myxococcota bacterium]
MATAASKKGIPISCLLDDLSHQGVALTEKDLSRRGGAISWDHFISIIGRVRDELGSDEALKHLGEELVSTDSFSIFKRVGRALSTPRDIYTMGVRWAGPSFLPIVHAEMYELPDGRLVQTLTLDDSLRECPALFHILHGVLISAPRSWGHQGSDVEVIHAPRRATYTIEPSVSGQGRVGRFFRALGMPRAYPSMLREIEDQQSAIKQSYLELRGAHDRIAGQAADLAQVNSIGRELAEDIDINHLADALLRVLQTDLGFSGAELWLLRAELPDLNEAGSALGLPSEQEEMIGATISSAAKDQPRFFRREGMTDGPPHGVYPLEAAGRPLGALHLWTDSPDEAEPNTSGPQSAEQDPPHTTKDALLARLLPWIAMAIDNARSYEAIEKYAANLEERVKERTARLLSANHHLVREIDERRRATDALIASEAQLRASERLASIGTLAAGIAHEINNPIGSILAAAQFAQVTKGDPDRDQQIDHALTDIETEAKRCGDIVRSILQFSRDERTEKWPCRMLDIVRRSVRLTSEFATEREVEILFEEVRAEGASDAAWAHVNPIQIEQALVNLIRNGIESGSERVEVRSHFHQAKGIFEIQILDEGPGIEPDDRHRIFDPFYTTKQDVGGTGLGLSVVHGIATEHGGNLELNPRSTRGTIAAFALPTCPPPAVPIEDKPVGAPDLRH